MYKCTPSLYCYIIAATAIAAVDYKLDSAASELVEQVLIHFQSDTESH